jgi:DNA-directed RNA polymerase subunit RPC12/RpoP
MNWITAKFKSECCSCTRNIDEGERILYDHEEREARCSKCGERVKPDPKKGNPWD